MASQGRCRFFGHGPADRVVDGIHPAAVCRLPQATGQVVVSMVDDGLFRAKV
jgi:hypothetical protein